MSNHATHNTPVHTSPDVARLQHLVDMHQGILDALPMIIVAYEVIDQSQFHCIAVNHVAVQSSGYHRDMVGAFVADFIPPDQAVRTIERLQHCLATNAPLSIEETFTSARNIVFYTQSLYLPIPTPAGQLPRVLHFIHDITAQKVRELAERAQQEGIIEHQQATLAELSTPLLSISDTTVVMPLIGTIDSRRIQQIMEMLLAGVAESRATYVILDITGVQVVDTQVASAFVRAAQAVSLLGAQTIITGIRSEVAQTLVQLGIDLSSIVTRGTLQSGIAYAREREQRG